MQRSGKRTLSIERGGLGHTRARVPRTRFLSPAAPTILERNSSSILRSDHRPTDRPTGRYVAYDLTYQTRPSNDRCTNSNSFRFTWTLSRLLRLFSFLCAFLEDLFSRRASIRYTHSTQRSLSDKRTLVLVSCE